MNESSILIIEGDKAAKSLVAIILEVRGCHYIWTDKERQGILSTASRKPDITLPDLGPPDMDGVDVILKTRSWVNTPIIVISAKSEDSNKIAALGAGVDDYLTEPFSVDEFLVRLYSTQRQLSYIQSLEEVQTSLFANGGLTIDYAAGYACLDGEKLHLTPYEYKLLRLLTHDAGRVLTYSCIIREIWGVAWEGGVVSPRVFTTSLWKKIGKNSSQPQYIQTYVGVEYRMMKR